MLEEAVQEGRQRTGQIGYTDGPAALPGPREARQEEEGFLLLSTEWCSSATQSPPSVNAAAAAYASQFG